MFLFIFLLAAILPLCMFAAVVLTFVASWKVHEKAGLPGWSGIIPYYNYYTRAELCGMIDTFWKCIKLIAITFGVMILGSILTGASTLLATIGAGAASEEAAIASLGGGLLITLLLSVVIGIACFVLMIMALVQLIKIDVEFVSYFGKSTGFAVGMMLVPYVFLPMLAWGNATWGGDDDTIDAEGEPIV